MFLCALVFLNVQMGLSLNILLLIVTTQFLLGVRLEDQTQRLYCQVQPFGEILS